MIVPQLAIDLLKEFEGFKDGDLIKPHVQPYHDHVGYPTIGWGRLLSKKRWDDLSKYPSATLDQCENYLAEDALDAARSVRKLIRVELSGEQFSALISFTFNLGGGALQASTLRRLLNRGEYYAAADEFPKWKFAGGKPSRGLLRRRLKERQVFLDGCGS